MGELKALGGAIWASFILMGLSPASVIVDKEKIKIKLTTIEHAIFLFMVSPSFCAEAHEKR
jgi:hypothetical protein